MIVKNKINGIPTKRTEVIGNFRPGGFSSRLSFFNRLFTELRIRYDNNNNLWISQWSGNGGLQRIENEQIVEKINFNDGLPDSRVTDFDFSSDGRIWIGTPSGLAVYNYSNKKIICHTERIG